MESSRAGRNLTSRERILIAVRGEAPDMVPVCPRGIQPLRRIYGGDWPSAQSMVRAARELDFDCVLNWGPGAQLSPDVRLTETAEEGPNGVSLLRTVLQTPRGTLERVGFKTNPMTHGAFISSLTSATTDGAMIDDERDLEILETVYRRTEASDVAQFQELERAMGEQGIVQGEVINPMNLAVRDIGAENLMMSYIDRPDFVKRLLRVYQRVALWQMEALLDAGARIIYSDGVWCTTDLWSAAHIEDLISPLIKEQAALAHQAEAFFHLFMDGNCMAALEQIADMGVDILSPLETPPSGDANVAEAKRRVGNRMCLWGGVNAYWDVMQADKDSVRKAVYEAIAAGADGGGYVLSTADSIYEPCPLENVLEFFAAAREYGSAKA